MGDDVPVTSSESASGGRLVLAAVPIGNVGDASPRLVDLLRTADLIAAEDTRRLHRLCAALDVTPAGRVLSYHEHNEGARTETLLDEVERGGTVAVVTDAGMPSVSDPGFTLVRAASERGHSVTVLPGPSAVLTALAVSGLPSDRFAFEGFPPRKPGERRTFFNELADDRRTTIFFESPHRTAQTLAALRDSFGADRPAAVCRELTKTYEEVIRGSLTELARWADENEVRGEICVVVAGRPRGTAPVDLDAAAQSALDLVQQGARLSEAASVVAASVGLPKRAVYEAAMVARRQESPPRTP